MTEQFCCGDFNEAVQSDVLTKTEEDENNHTTSYLDGWYIRGRPYDSWYGHFGKFKRFNHCPFCGAKL